MRLVLIISYACMIYWFRLHFYIVQCRIHVRRSFRRIIGYFDTLKGKKSNHKNTITQIGNFVVTFSLGIMIVVVTSGWFACNKLYISHIYSPTPFQPFENRADVHHGVWKSQKKSHPTLRAKRAKLTFWMDKSWLKMPKMVFFGKFLKIDGKC